MGNNQKKVDADMLETPEGNDAQNITAAFPHIYQTVTQNDNEESEAVYANQKSSSQVMK